MDKNLVGSGDVTNPTTEYEDTDTSPEANLSRELKKRLAKPEQQQLEASPEQRAKQIWEDPEVDEEGVDPRQDQIDLQRDNAKDAGYPVEEREQIKEDERKRRRELKEEAAQKEADRIERQKRGEPEPELPEDQKPVEQRRAEEKDREYRKQQEAAGQKKLPTAEQTLGLKKEDSGNKDTPKKS